MHLEGTAVNKISKTAIGGLAVAAAALGILTGTSASAADAPQAGNITTIHDTRIVDVPGHVLNHGQSFTVQVTGHAGVPAGATGVVVNLGALTPTASGALTAFTTGTGAPGTPTTTYVKGGEASSVAFVPLSATGALSVVNRASAGSVHVILSVVSYVTPAPAPVTPAAPTFGVGQLQVDGTTWAQYETAELGAPGGDQAAGTVRFTCKNAAAGCNVSLQAYSTGDGWTVYPRIVLEKEDNTNGAKLTCEYADGADNNGAVASLTSAPTTVQLGIGSTADCGGSQTTVSGAVSSINVPGSTGQGIHYDAFTTLTFAKSAS
jgi:hypothetical protein